MGPFGDTLFFSLLINLKMNDVILSSFVSEEYLLLSLPKGPVLLVLGSLFHW